MSLFSVPLKLNVARKSIGRLSQIMGVFWKYGFGEFTERIGFKQFLPKSTRARIALLPESTGARLREAFQELGPTFVKFGQMLSTRQDLFEEDFIHELVKLQDRVPGVPFEEIEQLLKSEWKKDWSEVLDWLDPNPLASASIAQVHRARLKTGQEIVLKVQRPKIKEVINQDSALLMTIAAGLEKYVPELRPYSVKGLIEEFVLNLQNELNFTFEAGYMQRMQKNFASWEEIKIPEVHAELSTARVIAEEYIPGIRISDSATLAAQGVDVAHLMQIAAKSFFQMILKDGLFHGDLHPGNIFVVPPSTIVLIDFGSVGVLSEKNRDLLMSMFVALAREDYESLAYDFMEMSGAEGAGADIEALAREARILMSPYFGYSAEQTNHGAMLLQATRIASKYLHIPSDWYLVFKAIATVEGMAKTVDPKFNTLNEGLALVRAGLASRVSKERIIHEVGFLSRDVLELVRILPREMKWWLKTFRARKFAFAFEDQGAHQHQQAMKDFATRIASSIGAVGLMLFSAILEVSPSWGQESSLVRHVVPIATFALGVIFILYARRK